MKKIEDRKRQIISIISSADSPVSGGELSRRLGVSRQIIVHDITLLRAEGVDIISTHSGYVIKASPQLERVFKVHHTSDETEDELRSIVRMGGTVADVFVWHKVYGKLTAALNIFSERGVSQFIDGIKSGSSSELMKVTNGYHYHTVRAESTEVLDKIEAMLKEKGFLLDGDL